MILVSSPSIWLYVTNPSEHLGYQYEVHVIIKKWESGVLHSISDVQQLCNKSSAGSNYKFYLGIDPQHYRLYY